MSGHHVGRRSSPSDHIVNTPDTESRNGDPRRGALSNSHSELLFGQVGRKNKGRPECVEVLHSQAACMEVVSEELAG